MEWAGSLVDLPLISLFSQETSVDHRLDQSDIGLYLTPREDTKTLDNSS